MTFPIEKIVVDCGQSACEMAPFSPNPGPYNAIPVILAWTTPAALILLIGLGILIYSIVEARNETKRARINNPPKQCLTCGADQS